MALQNTDLFYVQRGDTGHKIEYSTLQSDVIDGVDTSGLLSLSGGTMTGALCSTEVAIAADKFDLSDGNFFSAGAIAVPNPTGGVPGQSGLIRFTAVPTSLGDQIKLPNNFNITAASIVPFYLRPDGTLLLGNPVEVS